MKPILKELEKKKFQPSLIRQEKRKGSNFPPLQPQTRTAKDIITIGEGGGRMESLLLSLK